MHLLLQVLSSALVIVLTCGALHAEAPHTALTFEVDVRPILRTHCFGCHGATSEKKGGLDLRLVRSQVAGGDSGPAIAPNDPDASYLVERIRSGEMPPSGEKLSPREIETVVRWIAGGAKT